MPLRNLAVLPIKLWRPDERRKIEEQNYATVEESISMRVLIIYYILFVIIVDLNLLYIL